MLDERKGETLKWAPADPSVCNKQYRRLFEVQVGVCWNQRFERVGIRIACRGEKSLKSSGAIQRACWLLTGMPRIIWFSSPRKISQDLPHNRNNAEICAISGESM
jgi:hypothetical protein